MSDDGMTRLDILEKNVQLIQEQLESDLADKIREVAGDIDDLDCDSLFEGQPGAYRARSERFAQSLCMRK